MTLQQCGETILVEHVAFLRGHVGNRGHFLRIAHDGGHLMTTAGQFAHDGEPA